MGMTKKRECRRDQVGWALHRQLRAGLHGYMLGNQCATQRTHTSTLSTCHMDVRTRTYILISWNGSGRMQKMHVCAETKRTGIECMD
jgi:hypothetical protein